MDRTYAPQELDGDRETSPDVDPQGHAEEDREQNRVFDCCEPVYGLTTT